MKKLFLCCVFLWTLLAVPAYGKDLDLRGVWVSSVYNLDYPSQPGLSAAQLRQEADQIVSNAKSWGLNAIFFQVRPCADALYRSDIDPWSAFLSGSQGIPPDGGFDPLEYFIQVCHQQGLELHAWLNPYRITRSAAASREEAFAQLCQDHPARKLESCVVFHTDGCLYYDPGQPQVRQLILDTVTEILDRYAVDGIHLDDYFYPGNDFADQTAWNTLGGGFDSLDGFRRDAVNQLVRSLHDLVQEKLPQGSFGVAPAGIWATSDRMDTGVDTNGSQSYFDHYADSRKWVREGMVDYIMPQIYWEIGAEAGDFSLVFDWWEQTVADTGVNLYIGLAAYKSAEAQEGSVWFGPEELLRQLDAIQSGTVANGAVFFRYGSLTSANLPQVLGLAEKTDQATLLPALWPSQLKITKPAQNQAAAAGGQFSLYCTAPRGSQVTAFYGTGYQRLRPGPNGAYTGWLPAQTPYQETAFTAPPLVCAEKNGVLFVALTPCLITSVRTGDTIALEDIRWSQNESVHQVIFSTSSPCAASVDLLGDVITLEISPCRMGVLFHDEFFAQMELEQLENKIRYRLILPDDGQRRQIHMTWKAEAITLFVEQTPPADPEADP